MINEIWMAADIAEKALDEIRSYHPDLVDRIFDGCLLDCAPSNETAEQAIITINDDHPAAECVRSVLVRHELNRALGVA